MSPADEHMINVLAQRTNDPLANRAADRLQTFIRLNTEAGENVESVICMRTRFTGNPPYVGWKGLGLALTEALDERDRLRDALRGGKGTEDGR